MKITKIGLLRFDEVGRWFIDNDELKNGDRIALRFRTKGMYTWLHGHIEYVPNGSYFLWDCVDGGKGWKVPMRSGQSAGRLLDG